MNVREKSPNGKRLIDANALMDVIRQHEYRLATKQGSIDYGMFTLGIQQAVDEQPTIDAVRDYMVQELLGDLDCRKAVSSGYEWSLKDGRIVELRVTIKPAEPPTTAEVNN